MRKFLDALEWALYSHEAPFWVRVFAVVCVWTVVSAFTVMVAIGIGFGFAAALNVVLSHPGTVATSLIGTILICFLVVYVVYTNR